MTDQAQFNFKNFAAGPNLVAFANTTLAATMRTAPYSATAEAEVEMVAGGFQTTIKIRWGVEIFTARSLDADVARSVQKALGMIRDELSKWRRDRILKSNLTKVGALGPILKNKRKPGV